jgi:type 1 glutamine amidotransferase
MLWTTEYGKGRVFITALGHDGATSAEPTFKVTFTRGAEWASTGKVTLPVPPEMAAP